jgi:hypothetical protein
MNPMQYTNARRTTAATTALLFALGMTACDGSGSPGTGAAASSGDAHAGHDHAAHPGTASASKDADAHSISHVKLPDGLVTRGEPSGTNVAACKASAKQGETVTVVGRIGGSRMPFANDVAVFTIVDPSLKSCADGTDPDHCNTPWDYCCEDREAMKRGMATIEFADAQGVPLGFPVRGASGLDPLATVAVTGVVVEKNDAGLMVVRATKVVVR